MSAAAVPGQAPFAPRLVLALIGVGTLAFLGFLFLSAYAPDMRTGGSGGGTHALSATAVGFRGVTELIDYAGSKAALLRDDQALDTEDLVVLTPETATLPAAIAAIVARRRVKPTLVVLPKWLVGPLPADPRWAQQFGTLDTGVLNALLAKAGRFKVERQHRVGGRMLGSDAMLGGARFRLPNRWQTVRGPGIVPLISDGEGRALLARVGDGKLFILADPDLLANRALKDPAGARAALAMLDGLNSTGAATVSFDLTLNGYGRGRNLLKLMFEPPFAAATLSLLAAALLVGIHAAFRFGAPHRDARAIPLGTRALVDNSAALIRMAKREHRAAERYAALTRDTVAAATGAPSALRGEALDKYLDRIGGPDREAFTVLAWRAATAEDRHQSLQAAQDLYRWRRTMKS